MELVDNSPSVRVLTGPNWCHAALSSRTIVVILLWAGESMSGCKEWPVWGKRQGCPIWPPHSDWTVWQSEGGRQHHKDLSVCLYTQNLSVIVGDTEREEGIESEGWEMEGQGGGVVVAVGPVSSGWAGAGWPGVFSRQEGLRPSGMLVEMHQAGGGQSDSLVPELARYRLKLKSGVTSVYSGTMGNVHWHVRTHHFRKG